MFKFFSVLDYCCKVQLRVLETKPATDGHELDLWFADTGRAATAVSNAVDGNDAKALRVAEALAERYGLE